MADNCGVLVSVHEAVVFVFFHLYIVMDIQTFASECERDMADCAHAHACEEVTRPHDMVSWRGTNLQLYAREAELPTVLLCLVHT